MSAEITIQICGSISSDPDYLEKFMRAERNLKNDFNNIFNPAKLKFMDEHIKNTNNMTEQEEWNYYMDICLQNIVFEADFIYMIKGWKKSKGARLEHDTGKKHGVGILYEQ